MKTQIALLLALAAPALQAATITWGASGAVSTSTEISTNGTLFEAWNVSGGNETINGTTFSGSPTNISTTFFNDINADFWQSPDPGGPDGAAYGRALDDARWADSPTLTGDITVINLTPGVTYEVQVWNADTRGCCNNRTRTYTAGNTLSLNTGNNGFGQWGIGTFVADAGGTQTINVAGPSWGPQLNMIQVRTLVPEPSVSLLGLGALGLMLRRRRA